MTATNSLATAMTLVSLFVVILRKQFIRVESFGVNSPTSEHHNPASLHHLATNLDILKISLSSSLLISSTDELTRRMDAMMELNDKPSKQRFMCLDHITHIMSDLCGKMEFVHAYIYSKDVTVGTWLIHVHIKWFRHL